MKYSKISIYCIIFLITLVVGYYGFNDRRNHVEQTIVEPTQSSVKVTCDKDLGRDKVAKTKEENKEVVATKDKVKKEVKKETKVVPEVSKVQAKPSKKVIPNVQNKVEKKSITGFIMPLEGDVINEYGFAYSDFFEDYRNHSGVDIKAELNSEVKAVQSGTVVSVENTTSENTIIVIDHGSDYQSRYCHLGESLISKGDLVEKGQVIGYIGNPGLIEEKEGAHLHLELKIGDNNVNPLDYLK